MKINESMKVLSDFTSFMIDNYNQQIDAKQKQIDQTQNEIDDLEGRLEKEKELKEQGFANDVELIQAELDAKKEQKAEQIRQEQELLDKKKQMQKVQLALDTVTQLSGLITSAVNIYEGFSSIPIVGIPLAIAMIGLMFGTLSAVYAAPINVTTWVSSQVPNMVKTTGSFTAMGSTATSTTILTAAKLAGR